ncbi:MAG: hypothetical protein ABR905_13310 [Terracidiphilus sp.]
MDIFLNVPFHLNIPILKVKSATVNARKAVVALTNRNRIEWETTPKV